MADGDVRDLLGDVVHGDPVGVGDAVVQRQRCVERRERRPRTLFVEPHLAAGEPVGVEHAHQQARIGDRRRRAAAPVAGRAGIGTCALRTDDDVAGRGDRDDAAAPGADAGDLGRERIDDQVVLERERVVDERPATMHQRDVGGRAADVAADQVGLADRLAQPGPGRRSRRRSGEHDPERLRQRIAPRHQRGRAIGEVELAGKPERPQLLVELAGVAAEHQLHHHVDHRRRRARILLGKW